MARQNCARHQEPVKTPKQEVDGPVAKFTVRHTYKGTYPDGCKAPRSYSYALSVDGHYISSAENTETRHWSVLKSIAERLNAHAEAESQDEAEVSTRLEVQVRYKRDDGWSRWCLAEPVVGDEAPEERLAYWRRVAGPGDEYRLARVTTTVTPEVLPG